MLNSSWNAVMFDAPKSLAVGSDGPSHQKLVCSMNLAILLGDNIIYIVLPPCFFLTCL
jgi:hypothetical protein